MIHWTLFVVMAFGAAIIGGLVTYFIFTSTFEELIAGNLREIHGELIISNHNIIQILNNIQREQDKEVI